MLFDNAVLPENAVVCLKLTSRHVSRHTPRQPRSGRASSSGTACYLPSGGNLPVIQLTMASVPSDTR